MVSNVSVLCGSYTFFFCLSTCFIRKGREGTECMGRWGGGSGGLEEGKCDQNILYEKRIQIKSFAKVF